jgi:hypothetical protein
MAKLNIGGISVTGNDISIIDNKIYIDGKLMEDVPTVSQNGILEVKITEGVLENLSADGSVTAGSVKGNINAGGSVNCDCVGGSVNAGGSVRCGRVGGSVSAGGSIRHA